MQSDRLSLMRSLPHKLATAEDLIEDSFYAQKPEEARQTLEDARKILRDTYREVNKLLHEHDTADPWGKYYAEKKPEGKNALVPEPEYSDVKE